MTILYSRKSSFFNDLLPKEKALTQRTSEEISILILEAAQNGATKTSLMFSAYLSHEAIGSYLSSLQSAGLVEYISGEMKFKTTLAGLKYLSVASTGDSLCNHQCERCGGMYNCDKVRCNKPFNYSKCNRCQEFPRFSTSRIIESEVGDLITRQ